MWDDERHCTSVSSIINESVLGLKYLSSHNKIIQLLFIDINGIKYIKLILLQGKLFLAYMGNLVKPHY